MADNFTSASFSIPVKDETIARKRMDVLDDFLNEEVELPVSLFPEDKVDGIVERLKDDRDWGCSFAWDVGGHQLCLYHDESISMEQAVSVAMIMLDLDDNNDVFTAEWADTCSRPRVGEFGGGAVAFNRHTSVWKGTAEMAAALAKELS